MVVTKETKAETNAATISIATIVLVLIVLIILLCVGFAMSILAEFNKITKASKETDAKFSKINQSLNNVVEELKDIPEDILQRLAEKSSNAGLNGIADILNSMANKL